MKKSEVYPLRYTEDFFVKFDEVAARISSTGAEDISESGSSIQHLAPSLLACLCLLLCSFSSCCLTPQEAAPPGQEAPRWQMSTAHTPRGVVLVAHGLNLRPSAMDELCRALNAHGLHTYRPSFTGHYSSSTELFSALSWIDDFAQGYRTIRTLEPNLPLFVVGFSAGGLVATHFFDSHRDPDLKPDRMVLLAPALALRFLPRTAYLLRWLGPLSVRVPNLTPAAYRRLSSTPLFWYSNTIDLYDQTRTLSSAEKMRSIPTLILLRRDDELISLSGLTSWIEENNLSASWQIRELPTATNAAHSYDHLIIDQASLGDPDWKELIEMLVSFLVDSQQVPAG